MSEHGLCQDNPDRFERLPLAFVDGAAERQLDGKCTPDPRPWQAPASRNCAASLDDVDSVDENHLAGAGAIHDPAAQEVTVVLVDDLVEDEPGAVACSVLEAEVGSQQEGDSRLHT